MRLEGNIVDLVNLRVFYGALKIEGKKIISLDVIGDENKNHEYIMPGFIDSHIHIESSMLTPLEFSRIALRHGTVAVVSDAHEIANVSGIDGVKFMINNAALSPLKFYFSAPSCVPFDAGSPFKINSEDVNELMKHDAVNHLGEVMNVQGVLNGDEELLKKIEITRRYKKAVDGHAPGLTGEALKKYAAAGITTDHECVTLNEALEKISHKMMIQIREGSAAKDFDALYSLLNIHPECSMLASDDRHPYDLLKGHINLLVKKAVSLGVPPLNALRAASLNPIKHYKLQCGLLQPGDFADFIIVDNLTDFNVSKTYINAVPVYESGKVCLETRPVKFNYIFNASPVNAHDLKIKAEGRTVNVIEALDGSLMTKKGIYEINVEDGLACGDKTRDIIQQK